MPIRTGADYIKALQDGREIWNAGRRIEDVTKHSGFIGHHLYSHMGAVVDHAAANYKARSFSRCRPASEPIRP